jgi:hypothetical protein
MQTPPGPINDNLAVILTCDIKGGNPLATVTWTCEGSSPINPTGNPPTNTATVASNHFHSVKSLLFSSARSRDFDGILNAELPVSMYTTKIPIDMCRFNVRSST